MKNIFSKSIVISALLATTSLVTGCAGGSDDNTAITAQQCAVGYTSSGNQCYPIAGYKVPGYPNGFNQTTTGYYADNYSGTSVIRVVNASRMKQFFKFAMGVCDRASANYGLASCDAYVGGSMDMIINFPNNSLSTAVATFIARPKVNPYGNYQAQLPSGWGLLGIALGSVTGVYIPDPKYYTGAYRNPLQLSMTVSAINNSAGFEARGYGDYWTGANTTLLAIQVPTGKIQDNQFNFNFMVGGENAAQGTMTKCRTLNCGL